jgi:hypothetical protein
MDCTTGISPIPSGLPSHCHSTKTPYSLRNFSLLLRRRSCLQSSRTLHSVYWYPFTEAVGQPIGTIFKEPRMLEEWIFYRWRWVRWAVPKRRKATNSTSCVTSQKSEDLNTHSSVIREWKISLSNVKIPQTHSHTHTHTATNKYDHITQNVKLRWGRQSWTLSALSERNTEHSTETLTIM